VRNRQQGFLTNFETFLIKKTEKLQQLPTLLGGPPIGQVCLRQWKVQHNVSIMNQPLSQAFTESACATILFVFVACMFRFGQ
jgi:hypothetical protein